MNIPSENEIREAAERINKAGVFDTTGKHIRDIEKLLIFATTYLDLKEPKEIGLSEGYRNPVPKERQKDFDKGYNQALRTSKLWLMKKLQKIKITLEEWNKKHSDSYESILHFEQREDLAETIQDLFKGE